MFETRSEKQRHVYAWGSPATAVTTSPSHLYRLKVNPSVNKWCSSIMWCSRPHARDKRAATYSRAQSQPWLGSTQRLCPGSENEGAGCFFCQNLSTIWFPRLAKIKKWFITSLQWMFWQWKQAHRRMQLLFPKKAKQSQWSGLKNWPGLHRRQRYIRREEEEGRKSTLRVWDTETSATSSEQILKGKKLQKTKSTTHCAGDASTRR